jgi:hypothetical protein
VLDVDLHLPDSDAKGLTLRGSDRHFQAAIADPGLGLDLQIGSSSRLHRRGRCRNRTGSAE